MTGIGGGEYDPILVAGLVIDIFVILLQGVKGEAGPAGQLLAVTIIFFLLGIMFSSIVGVVALAAGVFYVMKRGKKI